MNELLIQKTATWMGMERATEKERILSDKYYDENLMPLIIEEFIQKSKDQVNTNPEYMIISVGTSYEPITLSIKLLNPKKVLFLYTDQTIEILDKIIEMTSLKPSQYDKRKVGRDNSLIIYKEIKSVYLEWGKPKEIFVDFTGGTKAMAAVTAMAGAMINAKLIYIGTEKYLKDFRKPHPGYESMTLIANPYEVFGDLDEDRAVDLFKEHDYCGAKRIFEQLYTKVPEPRKRQYFKILYLLAAAYEHWDALELKKASSYMDKLVEELKKDIKINENLVMMDKLSILENQSKVLNNLAEIAWQVRTKTPMDILLDLEDILPLIFTIYRNAIRREEQIKYDMSSLLLYRLLEMIMQRRLSTYSIYVSDAEYEKAFSDKEALKEFQNKVISLRRSLFGNKIKRYLPDQISLLEGYIQLAALGDDLIEEKPIKFLRDIFKRVRVRNENIFAHGFTTLDEKSYTSFKDFVESIFNRFCEIESIDKNEYNEMISFISPDESMYYE